MKWLVLLLPLLVSACAEPQPPEQSPRTVVVQRIAANHALDIEATYSGEVRARHEHELGFRIGGKLEERTVDVGDTVRPGDVLARLDPQDVALARRAADSQVAAAEAQLSLASAELARVEALHRTGFVSASALDARKTAVDAAQAALRAARAQAELSANQSGYAVLRSEVDGVVVAVLAEAGQVVAAGQPVLRLVQPDEREVVINVPESRIGDYAPGRKAVVVKSDSPGLRLDGTVREVAPSADRLTRTYALRVAVDDAAAPLPLGSTASVVFHGGGAMLPMLPLAAVTAIESQPTVWVVDDQDRLQTRAIEVESFSEQGVRVRAGLGDGARVVVAGVHRLVAGELVRAIEADAPPALDVKR